MGVIIETPLSQAFREFIQSGKASGLLLILCTIASLVLANSPLGDGYVHFWHLNVAGLSLAHWINDGLMAIFFLLIGLELERELYDGELSDLRNALLPTIAALGGVVAPALIHYALNGGTPSQPGMGIPMATDIAFALAVLALLGRSVPASLKVFLVALAVIDDLAAIVVIAIFYTADLALPYLAAAFGLLLILALMNWRFGVRALTPYLCIGVLVWGCMLKSGVHATIAGVLLAFVIPYARGGRGDVGPSQRLEHTLHKPVGFGVLPLFALANTAIVLGADWAERLTSTNSLGIALGLLIGKPLGIVLLTYLSVASGICRLPLDLSWRHIAGAGMLGGIGFTMSIFISNLAFPQAPALIDASKVAILIASVASGLLGFIWLKAFGRPTDVDTNPDTVDLSAGPSHR
jgi:Na+:H+ antiporter, NhaA family